MKLRRKDAMISAGKRMYASGLVAGTLGSIGSRLSENEIVITRKGSRLGSLCEDDLIVLNGEGIAQDEKRKSLSDDTAIHYQVLKTQNECQAVIRVYSPYAVALAHRGKKGVEKAMPHLENLGGVAFVPYYRPRTAGLAGAVSSAMRENHVVIIEQQGPVVMGTDLDDAIDRAEALEACCKIAFILSSGNGSE
ncbi:MAG: class II aldolase/adducin family protein [Actinomycetota bacterium]|nr:class II aldolase/adducin family protein [Actinomycetota bacterium]